MSEAQNPGLSRRRILIGAAWTTPAVLIATGSPPAAASPINVSGDALNISYANGYQGSPGELTLQGGFDYNPDNWTVPAGGESPIGATATFHWTFTVYDSNTGDPVGSFSGSEVLAGAGHVEVGPGTVSLPPGLYFGTLEVTLDDVVVGETTYTQVPNPKTFDTVDVTITA